MREMSEVFNFLSVTSAGSYQTIDSITIFKCNKAQVPLLVQFQLREVNKLMETQWNYHIHLNVLYERQSSLRLHCVAYNWSLRIRSVTLIFWKPFNRRAEWSHYYCYDDVSIPYTESSR